MAFEAELAFAKDLARQAGEIMRSQFGTSKRTWKADESPVTEADRAINQLVIDSVSAAFPADGILGEEASLHAGRTRLWVCDPIDGTRVYDLGVPISTFCLALVVDGEPVLGVVYDPYLDHVYWAVRGEGAYCNDTSLAVSDTETLQRQPVLQSGDLRGIAVTAGAVIDRISEAGAKAFSFRSTGYGFMKVASGKAAAMICGTLYPWDLAAAMVILGEAGAMITDAAGGSIRFDQRPQVTVASNGRIHGKVLQLLH